MTKQYCTCKGDYVAYGLFAAGPATDGQVKWVHTCGRPHYLYWQAAIRTCPECWENFSAPWEELCKTCCSETRDLLVSPYRSWQWARGQSRPERLRLVGTETTLAVVPTGKPQQCL